MDVRLLLASIGLCIALLLSGGCSPSDEKRQVSLDDKTAQFEKSLDSIQDPKLKEAIADLGGSLLLLERARLKLESKPIETEYGEDALALLKHYPSPQALVEAYINGLFVLRKASSSDYLIDLQPVFPFNFTMPAEFPFPHGPGMAVRHPEQQKSHPLSAGVVGNRPGHPAQPFEFQPDQPG